MRDPRRWVLEEYTYNIWHYEVARGWMACGITIPGMPTVSGHKPQGIICNRCNLFTQIHGDESREVNYNE